MKFIYLFFILVIIKIAGWAPLSWWLVTMPLWIIPAAIIGVFFLIVAFGIILMPIAGLVVLCVEIYSRVTKN